MLCFSCKIPRKNSDGLRLGHVFIAGPVATARSGAGRGRKVRMLPIIEMGRVGENVCWEDTINLYLLHWSGRERV